MLEARRKLGKGEDIPENFPFEEARRLFRQPEVVDTSSVVLKWGDFDEAGLRQYLIEDKQFAAERIEKVLTSFRLSLKVFFSLSHEQFALECIGKGALCRDRLKCHLGARTVRRSIAHSAAPVGGAQQQDALKLLNPLH